MIKKTLIGVLAAFIASTYKTLPFVYVGSWYYIIFKTMILRRWSYLKAGKKIVNGITPKNGSLAVFTPIPYHTYVAPMEIDMYMHKSNSTYFSDFDLARSLLLVEVLQKGFYNCVDNDDKDFKSSGIKNIPVVPLGKVECYFKKELKLFEKVEIRCKIMAWDEKWLYIVGKFIKRKGNEEIVCSIGVAKYVFKHGRRTLPPELLVKKSELLNDEVKAECKKNIKLFEHGASQEDLEKACEDY